MTRHSRMTTSLDAAHGNRKMTLNHSYAVIGLVRSRKAESFTSCGANSDASENRAFEVVLRGDCSHVRRHLAVIQ
jgi:hypothetical protein